MRKRIISLLLAVSALVLLTACGQEDETTTQEKTATAVEITKVTRGSISAQSTVSGQVASGDEQSVSVALSTRCTDVYVEVGDTVSAGQALCTLDVTATMANYKTASLSYSNAKKSYNDQSALLSQQVAQAEKNYNDTLALFEMGAASQMEVDNAKLTWDNARTSMTSALDQLQVGMQNYQATMQQLESSLANINSNGSVVAPISGTIQSLSATKNGFVSPSMPIATIESTSDMEVQVGVSESLVSKISVGNQTTVSIDSANKTFMAPITSIDKVANAATHLYGVTIKIPSSYVSGLLSGMFADVNFKTDTQSDVVIVPTEAIQTGVDGQYVYTLDADNIAHKVAVQTGLVGDGETEVTSGLAGGETLVTVGQFYLSDGAEARVVTPEVTQ